MTFMTNDYLEYYLTLLGWIINNGIWNMISDTGLFAVPFVAIVMREWLKVRGEGADEGNKGVLSAARIENRVFVAIVVVMFAGIPFIDVDLNTIQYDSSRSAQCQVSVAQPGDTGWSQSFSTINNQSAKVPVWWAFMHALSRAVTGASVAAIPCAPICGRCAWRSTPRASTIRCWLRRWRISRATATGRRAPSCSCSARTSMRRRCTT